MKKKQFKRFIAWGFTLLAVFLIASFSVPFSSFASSVTLNIQNRTDPTRYGYISIDKYDGGSWVSVYYSYSSANVSSVSLDDSFIYRITISSNYKFDVNFDVISTDFNVPTHLSSNWLNFGRLGTTSTTVYYYFTLPNYVAPTPDPTPTPTPTAPPTPTQDPTITSDIQFWGRVNTNANGFWQVLTQIFNGIFNNVVMRNMIVYIPLFGLIITLVVYLFTFGGRHD